MNKIGFTNFRRFIKFEPIEFKGITFLVGRNNSGKSTLEKALLLVNDFFKSGNISTFSFGNLSLEDANIVTFGRAKNNKTNEDWIAFDYHIHQYTAEIVMSGDDDKTFADVHTLLITDTYRNLNFLFEPINQRISIYKEKVDDPGLEANRIESIKLLNSEINRLQLLSEDFNVKVSSKEFVGIFSELNALKKRKKTLENNKPAKESENEYHIVNESFINDWNMKEIIDFTITDSIKIHDREFMEIQNGKESSIRFENFRAFKIDAAMIQESFDGFYKYIMSSSLIYLGANPSKQSALFLIRDRTNALAQAIHEFYQLRILPGEKAFEFVEKWMKIFEVGASFEVFIHGGEAYEIKIASNDTMIHLSDKGMGSIQAMLLLLRLASVIHKRGFFKQPATVIIEEPELNLHPALQSKLADMFLALNQEFQINFIIETHSEYLLRRSQVLVAQNEFEVKPNENPFCAYYFPNEEGQQPYRLEYNEHGVFNKNFGEGFFDEASASTLELLKLQRQKKA